MDKNKSSGKKIIVSACLYGYCTKYNGGNNLLIDKRFLNWKNRGKLIPVCPEELGGLSTPRQPAEIRDGRVVMENGQDVTENFEKGAKEVLKIAKENNVIVAIMKDGSPSCGCNQVYDGNFSGKKIKGAGVCARLLIENGIVVVSEKDTKTAEILLNEK